MKTNRSKTWFIKAVSMVAAVSLSVGLFAGCSKTANDKDDQGRTIVSVGSWPSKEGVELDNANARKARFEEANPDVVIEPDLWAFDRKTFYAKAAGGQLPTYFGVGFTEVPEIIASEYSADLTDALANLGYDGMLNEDVLEIVSDENGRIKAIPSSCYILGLAYNTEMLKAAGLMAEDGTPQQPKDWYELAEMAVKIKEATGKPGFVFPTANKNGGWIFTPVAWSFGVDFMEKDENGKWQATFNTPECVEALQYIKDLKWKYDVLPANNLIDGTEYYKIMGTAGAAIQITAGDVPRKLTQYGMTPEQFGMMAMPAGPKRHVTLLGGSVYCVKNDATPDQIDAALRWHETAYDYKLTEEFKTNNLQAMEKNLADGQQIGIKSMSIWTDKSEALAWQHQIIDENTNVNPNYVRLYNEFVAECPAEIQPEEPVCCQELYETLDRCIQEVLTSESADCAALIAQAAADFQANYLDNLTY